MLLLTSTTRQFVIDKSKNNEEKEKTKNSRKAFSFESRALFNLILKHLRLSRGTNRKHVEIKRYKNTGEIEWKGKNQESLT